MGNALLPDYTSLYKFSLEWASRLKGLTFVDECCKGLPFSDRATLSFWMPGDFSVNQELTPIGVIAPELTNYNGTYSGTFYETSYIGVRFEFTGSNIPLLGNIVNLAQTLRFKIFVGAQTQDWAGILQFVYDHSLR